MNGAVSPAMARALVDQAVAKGYRQGVLGFRAPTVGVQDSAFLHGGQEIRMVPCVSALAVREAILTQRPSDGWLLIVTDRDDEELGPGLLAQFVWQRLRRPDAWQAVQQRFAAQGIEARLAALPREVASGLLATVPTEGWPPAPAGVLTAGHAFGAVADRYLAFPRDADPVAVLDWTMRRTVSSDLASLRAQAGDALTDAVIDWITTAAGPIRPVLSHLLREGRVTDAVPLGLVLGPLDETPGQPSELARARLQHRWHAAPRETLQSLGVLATAVVIDRLDDPDRRSDAEQAIARADALVDEVEASSLMGPSLVLRAGLEARVSRLAELVLADAEVAAVEGAWDLVRAHRLAGRFGRPLHAAIRLLRWLSVVPDDVPRGLVALARRQADDDAWVDQAVNAANVGVDHDMLARAIEHVLGRVQDIRDAHDRQFAVALAAAPEGPTQAAPPLLLLEHLVERVVAPIAKERPALLLVLDGLSTGVATGLVDDLITQESVVELLLPEHRRRAAALALLPTITEYSRTSLLTGRPQRGDQATEKLEYPALASRLGLGNSPIFHKKDLDSSRAGHSLADEVRIAIADTEGQRLVTCVLNTIDDALDRSDPGGMAWTAGDVKHLVPLVRAARAAHRQVIITSDHGHVVERRRGYARMTGDTRNARWRPATSRAEADEVLVAGPRVLTDDARAVLAVDERLRFGPLKAGYHGGAAPAEVVVPVVLLAPDSDSPWLPAPPQQPKWWVGPLMAARVEEPQEPREDDPSMQPALIAPRSRPWSEQLRASQTFKHLPTLRRAVTEEQLGALVDALHEAPAHRLPRASAAQALGVPISLLSGALAQLTMWINVDGYPVLRTDAGTQDIVLDASLLAEQFGVER